ncbi:MAG TPA: hypothetical protein VIL64_03915 [Solirubrobacteraceae bacterium]
MDDKNLSRSEFVAIAGGLLLALGLFLGWYHLGARDTLPGHGHGDTVSGWQTHTFLRYWLLAAALAPLILAYIIYRGHALSWPRGEMTAVTAIAAFGFIAYNVFVSKPGAVPGQTSLSIGAFVALGGAIMMGLGAAIRSSSVERPRKPPGTI